MTSQEVDFDEIIKKNKVFRFSSELHHTENKTRQIQLKSIINLLDGIKTTEDNAQSLLNEMCKDLTDKSLRQKWSKLCSIHKITKIKEYLREIISNKEELKKIEKIAIDMVNRGELKTAKEIIYDNTKFKIKEIPRLKNEISKYVNSDNSSSDDTTNSE